jgi:hypothetical protein
MRGCGKRFGAVVTPPLMALYPAAGGSPGSIFIVSLYKSDGGIGRYGFSLPYR